ncbi:LysR family transcriptional regulator [Nocardioides sp.]|uniref:LysR family transcriptional regulator n=1 Tax=Nocardioides sp. TaxID=35761 RepID=UPI002720D178|nr:LysR family transcriptional regulator [Nocardioides sp.]MDO9457527.1 LysR family transcriptional regulator [Nocardioides sp.]
MELRQVRYFLAVVDTGTVTAAAEQLTIAQSAVSQQVARLERDLGVALFDRSRRTLRLTAAGERFVPAARALLASARAARAAVVDEQDRPSLRIGITAGLDHRTPALAESHRVESVSLPHADRLAQIADGLLDAAVVHGDRVPADLAAFPVGDDPLVVVVSDDHPLAGRAEVDVAALRPHPLLLAEGALGTPLADVVLRGCRAAGFDPEPVTFSVSSSPFTVVHAVRGAWTVFYDAQAEAVRPGPLRIRFPRPTTPWAVPVTLVVRRDRARLGAELARAV